MANLLELQNIGKSYGDESILSDISLTLEPGKILAITGQSGSGKTTLLSVIGLLQQADTGKVLLAGQDIGELDQARKAKIRSEHFGFVFQRARLINSLTALENVMVPAWLGRFGSSLEARARELLGGFELEHRLHHRPQELSLGQLRRVALARALLLRPSVILADEPTNDLDPVLAAGVVDSLFETRDSGTAVIIITHDLALAERADRVLHLRRGRLGSPDWRIDTAAGI